MKLEDKNIWILSSEAWGPIWLSKHHYAVELGRRGNRVYFIDPPYKNLKKKIIVEPTEECNVINVKYRFYVSGMRFYPIRFKELSALYVVNLLKTRLGCAPDIVWSFSYHTCPNLRHFKAGKSILHLVDYDDKIKSDPLTLASADHVLAVSKSIADKYRDVEIEIVPHGISEMHAKNAREVRKVLSQGGVDSSHEGVRIGYIGSLLSGPLDRESFMAIIKAFPQYTFEFIGPYSPKGMNIGYASNEEVWSFIDFLKGCDNVVLLGTRNIKEIVSLYNRYDIFLVLYRKNKINRVVSNSHKIMEYLSTGKVVFTTSDLRRDIEDMICKGKDNPIESFGSLAKNLAEYNSIERMKQRLDYVLQNTYSINVTRIEGYLG